MKKSFVLAVALAVLIAVAMPRVVHADDAAPAPAAPSGDAAKKDEAPKEEAKKPEGEGGEDKKKRRPMSAAAVSPATRFMFISTP